MYSFQILRMLNFTENIVLGKRDHAILIRREGQV